MRGRLSKPRCPQDCPQAVADLITQVRGLPAGLDMTESIAVRHCRNMSLAEPVAGISGGKYRPGSALQSFCALVCPPASAARRPSAKA